MHSLLRVTARVMRFLGNCRIKNDFKFQKVSRQLSIRAFDKQCIMGNQDLRDGLFALLENRDHAYHTFPIWKLSLIGNDLNQTPVDFMNKVRILRLDFV